MDGKLFIYLIKRVVEFLTCSAEIQGETIVSRESVLQ